MRHAIPAIVIRRALVSGVVRTWVGPDSDIRAWICGPFLWMCGPFRCGCTHERTCPCGRAPGDVARRMHGYATEYRARDGVMIRYPRSVSYTDEI